VADAEASHSEARQGDIRRSLADIGKARRLLGYEPSHRAADGLAHALEWYATKARSEATSAQ
jgi:UDP-N-acetylglucosamine 4-epimerase